MALNAAEEETLEALKSWWNENGRRLAIIVIVVFGGYTGFLLWQNSNSAASETASNLYEEILTLAFSNEEDGEMISDAESEEIIGYADQLMAEHSGSIYARYAALYAAQQHVRHGDLDAAETDLQWILDNPLAGMFSEPDEGLNLTATLRLGRVVLAKDEPERALGIINSVDPQGFEPGFAELRGDIYLSMGRIVDARDAYIAAQQAGSNSDGLRMKLQSLPADT